MGFVWFEDVSSDLAKAQAFFGALFGWTTVEAARGGYTMIANRGQPIGGYQHVSDVRSAARSAC